MVRGLTTKKEIIKKIISIILEYKKKYSLIYILLLYYFIQLKNVKEHDYKYLLLLRIYNLILVYVFKEPLLLKKVKGVEL